ncbi:hypothetical protein A2U01_0104028, partial [Trifolium medium]|nr:hypothetical protein [Trifolium medium]
VLALHSSPEVFCEAPVSIYAPQQNGHDDATQQYRKICRNVHHI